MSMKPSPIHAMPGGVLRSAQLDEAHIGHISGALGTIRQGDIAPRLGWRARLRTLLAILGPGLIVMVGDNDAGAFSTYAQAGQNYGTTLLWTLLLLIPVLYVNQEMVLRLGAVSGIGHARLIFERFGRFWGAFSVIDLFLLNALTVVTEFIGITLGLDYLGVPKLWGVIAAAALVMAAAGTGNFRRFERFALGLVFGSLLLIPVFLMIHPPAGQMAHDLFVPKMPQGTALNEVMLLIIAIVGTTVAPWQLFFQQSYVVDKRITPRFIGYERVDLCIGIGIVMVGAVAIMAFTSATFAGRPEFGNFADAGMVSLGMERYYGRLPAVLFTVALVDACIIGACAVSLATAYAIGDVFALRHSLHRKPGEAKGFYAIYFGLVALGAALVLAPGVQLGLLTNAVQALAGVLLPGASVFLLLLCNDPLGERAMAQPLHRRRGRGPGDAVGRPDRVGSLPRHFRDRDPGDPHRRQRHRPRRHRQCDACQASARPNNAGADTRSFAARDMADAAARRTAADAAHAAQPHLARRPARLSRHRRRARPGTHRPARDRGRLGRRNGGRR